jgi:phage terminase large subunit-like protein
MTASATTHSIRCAFTVDFDRKEMGYSPDRVDALVWALTELMIEGGARRRLLFV